MGKNHLERILYIDRLLREEAYPSRKYIAEKFEVSIKSIERDIEYMRFRLDAPIEYNRNRKGFYYANKGFYLPAQFLSESDSRALLLAFELLKQWEGVPLPVEADSITKILRPLIDADKAEVLKKLSENVVFVQKGVTYNHRFWAEVNEGIGGRHKLAIKYTAPGYTKPVEKTVHPYKLIRHKEAWYFIAFDAYHGQLRMFALSRVSDVQQTDQLFTSDPGFRLEDYIDPNFGVYREDEWFEVRLRMEPWMADIITEHLGTVAYERIEGPSVELIWRTNQSEGLKHWVMQWIEHIEVIEPQFLREHLKKLAENLRGAYGNET